MNLYINFFLTYSLKQFHANVDTKFINEHQGHSQGNIDLERYGKHYDAGILHENCKKILYEISRGRKIDSSGLKFDWEKIFCKNIFMKQFLKILFVCFIITNLTYCSSPDSSSSDSSDNIGSSDNSSDSDNSSGLVNAFFNQTFFNESKFQD